MLGIKLICVGKLRERFYREAYEEYSKRLSAFCRFETAELTETRLPENPSAAQVSAALEKEAAEIRRSIPDNAYTVALCVEDGQMPSEGMARLLTEREASGRPKLCFIIGGSYGLAESVKTGADRRLSMSEMTFPHHLARVMLAEQIYRGFKIKEGSRYHK